MPDLELSQKAAKWLQEKQQSTKEYDPLVTYYFINKSLHMSPGKVAVQTARAAQIMLYHELKQAKERNNQERQENPGCLIIDEKANAEISLNELYEDDFMHGNKSLTLKANNSQMHRLINGDLNLKLLELDVRIYPTYDIGATEVEPNSLTVIAVSPTRLSRIEHITRKFQLY